MMLKKRVASLNKRVASLRHASIKKERVAKKELHVSLKHVFSLNLAAFLSFFF